MKIMFFDFEKAQNLYELTRNWRLQSSLAQRVNRSVGNTGCRAKAYPICQPIPFVKLACSYAVNMSRMLCIIQKGLAESMIVVKGITIIKN